MINNFKSLKNLVNPAVFCKISVTVKFDTIVFIDTN